MVYTLRVFLLKILTYLVPVLLTFYIQGVLKLKKNNSGAKILSNFEHVIVKMSFTYSQQNKLLLLLLLLIILC